MRNRILTTIAGVTAICLLASVPASAARKLYRYTNAEGNTVVDYQVPADYVANGYEVLSATGVVLKVVPRALTTEEEKIYSAQEERTARAEAEEQRLRDWDESLLLRYSSVADIEAARERALRDLRIRLSILKSNKRSLKQQVENYQAQAADLERSGQEVDVARLGAIEDMQAEMESTERSINDREREIEEVSASYEADIARFEMLIEVVELRRTLLAEQKEKNKNSR